MLNKPGERLANWRAQLVRHPLLAGILRNMGWNLFGLAAPLLVAILAIPPLIEGIGKERFGLLTIGWILIGYFSLFDFGLGRALTQVLAQKLAQPQASATQRRQEVAALLWTALALMALLGCLAACILYLLSDWIILQALQIPPALRTEAQTGMYWLVAALPSVVITTGLRGVLEAHHAFKWLNLARLPLGVLTFAGPLAVLPWSNQIPALFATLFAVRILSLFLFLLACQRVHKGFWQMRFTPRILPQLMVFGGWMTVSNLVSPIMVHMDRFLIGSLLSLVAVTYYTTPFEMMTRMLVLPSAIAGVCFPLFAQQWKQGQMQQMRQVFWNSTRYLGGLMLVFCALLALATPQILTWWLSPDFATNSSTVMRLLAVGVVINGLAYIPFTLVQGIGQAQVTARFHFYELILYLPLLYLLLQLWGINGVALAWVIRVSLDAGLLYHHAIKLLRTDMIKPA